MELSASEKELVDQLLKFDLERFAVQLGLIDYNESEITNEFAVKILNLAEKISRRAITDEIRNICLLIIGMIWEHRSPHWLYLSAFIMQILSRLMLIPSAKMVDTNYDNKLKKFSSLGSLIAELKFSMKILDHQVSLGQDQIILSAFQKNMWDAIDVYDRLGISAPTSAGKSFVLINKVISFLDTNPGDSLYIVPTITLINQITSELRKVIKNYNFKDFNIFNTYCEKDSLKSNKNIFVLTQERALSALSQSDKCFRNLKLLIIDEIQNIERVANEDNDRSRDLYNLIQEFENNFNPLKIIIAGPRLKNIEAIVDNLFKNKNSATIREDLPPVLNVTYAFSHKNKRIYLKQYSTINNYPQVIEVTNSTSIIQNTFGKIRYYDSIHAFMSLLISKLNIDSSTIIFSPTKKQAIKTAQSIFDNIVSNSELLKELAYYIKSTVHPKYSLVKCIQKSVAYHHSGVPIHVRNVVEKAFEMKIIRTIVCTTTLLQGVNLPVKNLIARNPYLELKRNGEKLTDYEFANLRGRAGRLMKDFVGRAIVLDESMFKDSKTELFEYPPKQVRTGYGERFNQNKSEILTSLENGLLPSDENKNFNDLTVYIRQTILKYDKIAIERLERTGVLISKKTFSEVKSQLDNLRVPKNICIKNPHWDPFVLNEIYINEQNQKFYQSPTTPFENNYVDKFFYNIKKIYEITPYYYNKYFSFHEEKIIKKILISAQNWSKEIPLIKIINWKNSIDEDEVDNMLCLINTDIVYSLPKLLRPLVQSQDLENPILSFMEFGAYRPETRKLIELGISREIAVKLSNIFREEKIISSDNIDINETKFRKYLNIIVNKLNYWEKIQLKDFLL